MLASDVYLPTLDNMPQPKLRYLSDTSPKLTVEMLHKAYMMMAAVNLKKTKDSQPGKIMKDTKVQSLRFGFTKEPQETPPLGKIHIKFPCLQDYK